MSLLFIVFGVLALAFSFQCFKRFRGRKEFIPVKGWGGFPKPSRQEFGVLGGAMECPGFRPRSGPASLPGPPPISTFPGTPQT